MMRDVPTFQHHMEEIKGYLEVNSVDRLNQEKPVYHFGPGVCSLVLFDGGAKLLGNFVKKLRGNHLILGIR